jgi:hypothetical protein
MYIGFPFRYIEAVLDWLIIGGGVQGTYLSHLLTGQLGVSLDAIRVLDPLPSALSRWQQMTDNTGMRFLRSPAAHHIGIRTNELLDFAREHHANWQAQFLEPYLRPSLDLWNAHAASVIAGHRLEELRIRGSAREIARSGKGFRVDTDAGIISSRRVILAIGNSHALEYPAMTADSVRSSDRVRHVFDAQFIRREIGNTEHVLIVGSGVTAVQLALALAQRTAGSVRILTDRLPTISWFDSEPGWNGPRLLGKLTDITDPDARLALLNESRIRGSFPGDSAAELLQAMLDGRIDFCIARLLSVSEADSQVSVKFTLDLEQSSIQVDRLVYATGFSREIPATEFISSTAASLSLATVAPGWPVLNEFCEWTDELYVCGALAQLTLGPVSRNISGVRSFGRLLLQQFDRAGKVHSK